MTTQEAANRDAQSINERIDQYGSNAVIIAQTIFVRNYSIGATLPGSCWAESDEQSSRKRPQGRDQ
ncbi:hypothetical protein LCAA2362_2791 [Lacticaseibacillus casei A2-362]|nr:hypothetical protein LCAA2362_2791 [Lacticaseibacillus casei A2-362]